MEAKNKKFLSKNMFSGIVENPHRRIALIAGLSLLFMTISIILAEAVAMAGILVEGDAVKTFQNLVANQSRLRFGIVGHLFVILLDLIAAWALYVFLKPAKSNLNLLSAWFRLVYAIIYVIALTNLYRIFQLLGDADYLLVLGVPELQARSMLLFQNFRDVWDMGFVFFGIHLFLLGIVAVQSDFIPKLLGILLIIAGISYFVDYISLILSPDLGLRLSFIFGYGELIFMIWLLIWGGKNMAARDEMEK